jgi:8-oxo-dGTP diphosphatase
MFGPGREGHCGICSQKLPHRKITCSDCLLVYDDCEDWSGPAHSDHDCIRELVKQRTRPRIGVAVLVTDDKSRLLLGRRGKEPNLGAWVIPGGGIEHGETWKDAARRELQEETGLDITPAGDQQPYILEIIGSNEHRIILCVRATLAGGELKPSSDLLDARFFSYSQFPENVSPAILPVLKAFGWWRP